MPVTVTSTLDALRTLSRGIDVSAIENVTLDHQASFERLLDSEDELVVTSLTSTRIEAELGAFTLILTGTGFSPVSSAEELFHAIETGVATGAFDRLQLFEGFTQILEIGFTATGSRIVSGDIELLVDGRLPGDFGETFALVNALTILDSDDASGAQIAAALEALEDFSLNGLELREGGGLALFDIDLTATGFSLSLDGYTLNGTGTLPANFRDGAEILLGGFDFSDFTIEGATLENRGMLVATATDGDLLDDGIVFDVDGRTYTEVVVDAPYNGMEFDLDFDGSGALGPVLVLGFGGEDTIIGSGFDDLLLGGDQDDMIMSGAGNDTVEGGNGRDVAELGDGDDLFIDNGQTRFGEDLVFGNAGNDTLLGAGGDDDLRGQRGFDSVVGGQGNDTLRGNEGFDTLRGGEGQDVIIGGDGRDLVFMGGGDDLFADNGQRGDINADTVFANAGNDTVGGGGGTDVFHGQDGADLLLGRLDNDRLFGGNQDDTLLGGAGNDTLAGGNGRDRAFGGAGNDVWFDNGQVVFGDDLAVGGAGNDTFFAGGGDDTLLGGAGADIFDFTRASGDETIVDYQAGLDELIVNRAEWEGRSTALLTDGILVNLDGGDTLFFVGLTTSAGLEADVSFG